MIWIIIGLLVFCADCKMKKWAEENLSDKKKRQIGKTGFSLRLVKNYGFAFNRLDQKPELVKRLHLLVMGILSVYASVTAFFQTGKEITALGMAFILGGGLSNLFDRFKRGYVVDYLGIPGIKKLWFNMSDLFVFLGAAFVVLGEWTKNK